jgi:hypothetical protein
MVRLGVLLWVMGATAGQVEPSEMDPATVRQQVIDTALDDVRRSEAFYRLVAEQHERRQPFKSVARQKRKQAKKLIKLAKKLGLRVPPVQWREEDIKIPPSRVEACSQAVSHELRNVAIYEKAMELWGPGKGAALWPNLHRKARYKHLPVFEGCVRHAE